MLISRPAPEFNRSPAAGATLQLIVPINEPKRLHAITLRAIGYSNTNAELIASAVIDRVRVITDADIKCNHKPSLTRKVDEFFNSNADTLNVSQVAIMFSRHLDPSRGWGFANIGQLLLEVDVIGTLPANTTFTGLKAFQHYVPLGAQVPRGDVYVNNFFTQAVPVAGWNTIQNLNYSGIINASFLFLDAANITEVKIKLGSREVWSGTKEDALFWMRRNPLYKVGSGTTHAVVAGQTTTSTGGFPVPLDAFGQMPDGLPLFVNGVRQDFTIEYYVDTGISAAAAFDIYAEGVERDNKAIQPTSAGQA